ncbi:MAG: hypothetical protein J3R72DRAFT_514983 [Linnemannia gamsii]|nr:MAG: hypothetical protein J3R72DRAFT_514983 [Linnemannia gamsii]
MVLIQRSPPYPLLEIPEICDLIASYLSRKDCLECIRVSRDWFQYFVRPIWKTIDFEKDAAAFSKVNSNVLTKYGGFISQAVNISVMDHLQTLQHSKVNSLKLIKAQVLNSCLYQQILSDTIRRSEGSLRSIKIFAESSDPDTLAEQRKHGKHFFNIADTISSPPKPSGEGCGLTSLSLGRICVSRESFSSLMERCPSLQKLTLYQVSLFRHMPSLTLFAGSKLRYLFASFSQVWDLDPEDPSAPSLLVHFPLLEIWHVPSLTRSSNDSLAVMHQDISRYCPILKQIRFDEGDPATVSALLAKTFAGLELCVLSAQVLAVSTVLGLITHQNTLTSLYILKTYGPTNSDAAQEDRALKDPIVEWLYMIPRLCHRLQVLSLELFVCDINEIESHVWACADLRELRLRVKGLDSDQDIEMCLKQVRDRRRAYNLEVKKPQNSETIVTRVARHLLQFMHLKTVCLGTQVYNLPSPSL